MSSIESNICDAIEVLVDRAISKARFDRTIFATVVKCVDASIGKYLVRYQDSTFYAYTNSADVSYPKNAVVYILVPENDMSKEKSIIGAATRIFGSTETEVPDKEDEYVPVGTTCIHPIEGLKLSTYHTQVNNIYSANKTENIVTIDKNAVENYIKRSSSIVCGATFRTKMAPEQQIAGNYGIIFTLKFKDNTGKKEILRKYVIDINRMIGNPYRLTLDTRQTDIFDIDGSNFVRIESIDLFCEGFPNQKGGAVIPDSDWDIFIKNVELCGAVRLTTEELTGQVLILETPTGTIFTEEDSDNAAREIVGEIRVKGLPIDVEARVIPFYWFIQNVKVTPSHPDYNRYGGSGWKCLNDYNVISVSEYGIETREWIPGSHIYSIKKTDAAAYETKLKCVAIYEGKQLSKEITIINLNTAVRTVLLQSDSGTEFYYDNGSPILTCTVLEKDKTTGQLIDVSNQFTYVWAVQNNMGDIDNLPITTNVLHVQVSDITGFSIYRCSAFDKTVNENYCGTAEITLYNKLETKGMYSLVINNGSQLYTYDEAGISPASKSLENPIEIPELSYTLYDNSGHKIEGEALRECPVVWEFPINNTLLVPPPRSTSDLVNSATGIISFKNRMTLPYSIADQYSYEKFNNQISLTLTYKDLSITARTSFTFNKQGDPGTNGTRYTCRIVPHTSDPNAPYYLTAVNGVMNYGSYTFTNSSTRLYPFEVELWDNGQRIFRDYKTGNTDDPNRPELVTVKWEILKNTYAKNVSDNSNFSVYSGVSNGVTIYSFGYSPGYMGTTEAPANLLKATVTYRGQIYYAVEPIVTIQLNDVSYKIDVIDYTGFKHVLYSSGGQLPNYAKRPFGIRVTRNGGDVSSDTTFYWSVRGNRKNNSGTPIREYNLEQLSATYLTGLKNNETSFKPIDSYNGLTVNNSIYVTVRRGTTYIGYINIPVHLLLNKYGLANINEWDGNSVQVNEDGGYILSPQVGAGSKNNANQFTGVLMGEVKEANRTTSDIGILGYHDGDRTIFLDSKTGAGIFGSGYGQMAIDPSSDKALLYSRNYWKNYQENGLPSNYSDSNVNNQGMLIDLTTPAIKFGSGNFVVDANGSMIAKLGSIAGWSISPTAITSQNGSTILNSNGDIQLGQLGTQGAITLAGFIIHSGNGNANAGAVVTPNRVDSSLTVSGSITSKPSNSYIDEDSEIGIPGQGNSASVEQTVNLDTLVLGITDGQFVTLTGQELQFRNQNSRGLSIFAASNSSGQKATVLQPYDGAVNPAIGYLSNWNLVNIPSIRAEVIFQREGNYYQRVATEEWVKLKLDAAVKTLNEAINNIEATYENHSHNIDFSTSGNGTVTATVGGGGSWGDSQGRFNQAGTSFFKKKQFKEFVSEGKGNPPGVGIGNLKEMILVFPGPKEFAGGKRNVLYSIDMKNVGGEVMHTFQIQVTDTMSTDHLESSTPGVTIDNKTVIEINPGFGWTYNNNTARGVAYIFQKSIADVDLRRNITLRIDAIDVYNKGYVDGHPDYFETSSDGTSIENKTTINIAGGWTYNNKTARQVTHIQMRDNKGGLIGAFPILVDAIDVYNKGVIDGRTDHFTNPLSTVEINKKLVKILKDFSWDYYNGEASGSIVLKEFNANNEDLGTSVGISINATGVYNKGVIDGHISYLTTSSPGASIISDSRKVVYINGGWTYNNNTQRQVTQVQAIDLNGGIAGAFTIQIDAAEVYTKGYNDGHTDHFTTSSAGASIEDKKTILIEFLDPRDTRLVPQFQEISGTGGVVGAFGVRVNADNVRETGYNDGWAAALPKSYSGISDVSISGSNITIDGDFNEYNRKTASVNILNSSGTSVGAFNVLVDASKVYDKGYSNGVDSVDTDSYYNSGKNSVYVMSVSFSEETDRLGRPVVKATVNLSNEKSSTWNYTIK